MPKSSRITLIARHPAKPDVDWNYQRCRTQRAAFLDSIDALKFAMGAALHDVGLDVERIVVDRAGDGDAYLELLAAIPSEFCGDIVLVRDDGSGFLSATARGGDRILYSLSRHDIRFYLETHDLVTGRAAYAMTA